VSLPQDFAGKVGLVTGGTRGIGLGIAAELVARGAKVGITARKPDELETAVKELGGDEFAVGFRGSADDAEHQAEAVRGVIERFGSLDCLVNNAGINPHFGATLDADAGIWRKTLDVNVIAPAMWTQLAYQQWMRETQVPQDYVRVVDTEHTAQAFITTDQDDNQITAFHPGAMQMSHLNSIPANAGITLGIVSPDGRDGMVQHCAGFAAAGIPFIFDPGQGLPMFNGDDLRGLIGQASWLTVNDYEWQLVQQRTGWGAAEVLRHVKALVVTRGADGSTLYTPQGEIVIPAAKPQAVVDPTGCGDAYRAGLIHGLLHGLDWPVTGRIASLLGALKVATRGTQNHRFTRAGLAASYRSAFGTDLPT